MISGNELREISNHFYKFHPISKEFVTLRVLSYAPSMDVNLSVYSTCLYFDLSCLSIKIGNSTKQIGIWIDEICRFIIPINHLRVYVIDKNLCMYSYGSNNFSTVYTYSLSKEGIYIGDKI